MIRPSLQTIGWAIAVALAATVNLAPVSLSKPKTPNHAQRVASLERQINELRAQIRTLERVPGPRGEPGRPGPQGPQGPAGPRGEPGVAPPEVEKLRKAIDKINEHTDTLKTHDRRLKELEN